MCRPVCSVPVTLIMVLDLTSRKGILASYFYPCIAVISNLQCQESQRKKRQKKKAVFYTIIKFYMQRIENWYWRNQHTVLKMYTLKMYNYEYFLFSVKINCAIKITILKSIQGNHTTASWLIWSINFLFCLRTSFIFCLTVDKWVK